MASLEEALAKIKARRAETRRVLELGQEAQPPSPPPSQPKAQPPSLGGTIDKIKARRKMLEGL